MNRGYLRTGAESDRDRAIATYQKAIATHGDTFPIDRRRAASNLATLFYRERRYAEARAAYEIAHAAIQQIANFD